MAFLFDTCAISELASESPNMDVRDFLVNLPRSEIWFSIISVGEIVSGIEQLKESPRKVRLTEWLNEHLLGLYVPQTLLLDHAIVIQWGKLLADLRKQKRQVPSWDSLIAATALEHGLTVVTRNVADFAPCGVKIYNPWK